MTKVQTFVIGNDNVYIPLYFYNQLLPFSKAAISMIYPEPINPEMI